MNEKGKEYTLESGLTYLEGKTLGMNILEEYEYLEKRFNDAMNIRDMEEGSAMYWVFKAIVKRLSEIELLIKEG